MRLHQPPGELWGAPRAAITWHATVGQPDRIQLRHAQLLRLQECLDDVGLAIDVAVDGVGKACGEPLIEIAKDPPPPGGRAVIGAGV